MSLNSQKTTESSDIIISSIKSDKYSTIINPQQEQDCLQKSLINIKELIFCTSNEQAKILRSKKCENCGSEITNTQ
jgi:hypothetical protein